MSQSDFTLKSFTCGHCGKKVALEAVGTQNRNHCPFCLWSVHLDVAPGDRAAGCGALMEPVGLTFKGDRGELMLVHKCVQCGVVGKNRIAGDDLEEVIMELFEKSKEKRREGKIEMLTETDRDEIMTQLFGKPNLPK